jgi:hypothetical protein
MANYRVVLEIEVDADSPLEAAKKTQDWIREADTDWQYYVQPCDESRDVFSIDLSEEDEDAEQECDNYIPLIQ